MGRDGAQKRHSVRYCFNYVIRKEVDLVTNPSCDKVVLTLLRVCHAYG